MTPYSLKLINTIRCYTWNTDVNSFCFIFCCLFTPISGEHFWRKVPLFGVLLHHSYDNTLKTKHLSSVWIKIIEYITKYGFSPLSYKYTLLSIFYIIGSLSILHWTNYSSNPNQEALLYPRVMVFSRSALYHQLFWTLYTIIVNWTHLPHKVKMQYLQI